MTIRETIELQMQWWRLENTSPLVGVFAPVKTPYGGMDMDVKPSEIVQRKVANLRACQVVPADDIALAFPDFGPAFVPGLAGAGFEYDGRTTWSVPCASSILDVKIRPFDPQLPLWRRFIERFEPLLANWSWDTYLPAATVMTGPMDILSGMLGPETLAMEIYEHPDEVLARAMDAARLFNDVFEVQVRMIRAAGLTEGMADWMRTWMPGRGVCYSEDFAALCGESHFRQFFVPPNARIMPKLDRAYLHLHSGALSCLPAVLELPGLSALELSNDPSGPPMDALIAAGQKVQASGVRLQMSNWEHPLSAEELDKLLTMDPRGLKITLQASSLEEAQHLYQYAKQKGRR
jgi:hypothetical protein